MGVHSWMIAYRCWRRAEAGREEKVATWEAIAGSELANEYWCGGGDGAGVGGGMMGMYRVVGGGREEAMAGVMRRSDGDIPDSS